MVTFMDNIILICLVDLNSWVLGVDLPLNKAAEALWQPDIKADLPVNAGDFKAKVLLYTIIEL